MGIPEKSSPDAPPLWELERDGRGLLDSPIRAGFGVGAFSFHREDLSHSGGKGV